MLLDYGVFKLFAFDWALDAPKALRVVALVLAIAGLLALVVTKIVLRLTRDFSDSSLALVLEKRYPQILGDRLITAVQLADLEWARKYGYSMDMIKKTIDDVRDKIDEVPVNQVFNWRRLWVQGGVFLGAHARPLPAERRRGLCHHQDAAEAVRATNSRDVSAILAERDVLLQNTPWPRRAYLEVVDFPGDEMRIGRDVPSPKIRVAAYQWVVADSKAPVGWRPLTWADVQQGHGNGPRRSCRCSPSATPASPSTSARSLYGAAHPFTAPTLPADVAAVPDDLVEVAGRSRRAGVRAERRSAGHPGAPSSQTQLDGIAETIRSARSQGRRPVDVAEPSAS